MYQYFHQGAVGKSYCSQWQQWKILYIGVGLSALLVS